MMNRGSTNTTPTVAVRVRSRLGIIHFVTRFFGDDSTRSQTVFFRELHTCHLLLTVVFSIQRDPERRCEKGFRREHNCR